MSKKKVFNKDLLKHQKDHNANVRAEIDRIVAEGRTYDDEAAHNNHHHTANVHGYNHHAAATGHAHHHDNNYDHHPLYPHHYTGLPNVHNVYHEPPVMAVPNPYNPNYGYGTNQHPVVIVQPLGGYDFPYQQQQPQHLMGNNAHHQDDDFCGCC